MRFKAAYQYQIKTLGRVLMLFYGWTVVGLAGIGLLQWLLFDRHSSITLGTIFFSDLLSATVLFVFLLVYGLNTYDAFTLLIQNGIGRRTYFWSKLATMGSLILLGETVNVGYGYFYKLLIAPQSASHILYLDFLYGRSFETPLLSFFVTFMITALIYLCLTATAMFVGSILARFTRRTQLILLVGGAILLFILLMALVKVFLSFAISKGTPSPWFKNLVGLLIGANGQVVTYGQYSVISPLILDTGYSLALLAATYWAMLKLRVPR